MTRARRHGGAKERVARARALALVAVLVDGRVRHAGELRVRPRVRHVVAQQVEGGRSTVERAAHASGRGRDAVKGGARRLAFGGLPRSDADALSLTAAGSAAAAPALEVAYIMTIFWETDRLSENVMPSRPRALDRDKATFARCGPSGLRHA